MNSNKMMIITDVNIVYFQFCLNIVDVSSGLIQHLLSKLEMISDDILEYTANEVKVRIVSTSGHCHPNIATATLCTTSQTTVT